MEAEGEIGKEFEHLSSLNQKTGPKLHRQPQRIGKKKTAECGQRNANDNSLFPPGLGGSKGRYEEGGERGYHQTKGPDHDGEGKDRQRDEQRPSPGVGPDRRT